MQSVQSSHQVLVQLLALADRVGVEPSTLAESWGPLLSLAWEWSGPGPFAEALPQIHELWPQQRERHRQARQAVRDVPPFAAALESITAPYGIWADWPAVLEYLGQLAPPKALRGRPAATGHRRFPTCEAFLEEIRQAGEELQAGGEPLTQWNIGAKLLGDKYVVPQRGMQYWMGQFDLHGWENVLKKAGLRR